MKKGGSKKKGAAQDNRTPMEAACLAANKYLIEVEANLKKLGIESPLRETSVNGMPDPARLVATIVLLADQGVRLDHRVKQLERDVKSIADERDRAKLKHEGGLEALQALGRGMTPNMGRMPSMFDYLYGPRF